ncbi:MAG: hypothetical protein ACXVCP_09660 [Bdellovibrio sp.]
MKYQNVKKADNPCFKLFSKRNQNGNAVLFILGGIIVLNSVLQTAGFGGIFDNNSVISTSRMKASRDSIDHQLDKYASLPASIRNSLSTTENVDLRTCVLGSSTALCNGGTEYPLKLSDPTNQSQFIAGPGPVSGGGTPVLYDGKGNICSSTATSGNLSCPFEVYTTFTAQCAASAATCATADSIQVHYRLRIPDNLFSNSGSKNNIQLATIDKFANYVKVNEVLPHPYGWVAGHITNVTSVISGTTTTTQTPTYDDAVSTILTVIGGSYTDLAKQIADSLYQKYGITDLSLIAALSSFWLQNAAAAQACADELSWEMANTGLTPDATFVNNVAASVLPYNNIPNPAIAIAIAYGLTQDSTQATTYAQTLAGITDINSAKIIVDVKIQDPAIATAVANAFTVVAPDDWSLLYQIASAARDYNLTDGATLLQSTNVILAGDYSWSVRQDILVNGVTDPTIAQQMQLAYDTQVATTTTTDPTVTDTTSTTTTSSTTTATTDTTSSTSTTTTATGTTTSTDGSTSTTTSGTTSTTTTTTSTSSPTLVQACTDTTSCAGTVGM